MKNYFISALLFVGLFLGTAKAQQIGVGYTTSVSSFDAPLFSGGYVTTMQQLGFPANQAGTSAHLFSIRTTTDRNYQMQLASSFNQDDRLFFRKLAIHSLSNASIDNVWYELATRGVNTFTGNQVIKDGGLCLPQATSITMGSPDSNNGNRLVPRCSGQESYLDYYPKLTIRTGNLSNSSISDVMTFTSTGNVGIGTINPANKLDVNGTIRAKEMIVETGWADFVFEEGYKMPTLDEVKQHIDANKHLPGIPSETEVKENGVNLGDMQVKLLQKIEELTLYAIQQQETIEVLKEKIEQLEKK